MPADRWDRDHRRANELPMRVHGHLTTGLDAWYEMSNHGIGTALVVVVATQCFVPFGYALPSDERTDPVFTLSVKDVSHLMLKYWVTGSQSTPRPIHGS